MNSRVIGAIDLAVEAFFAACLSTLLGAGAWRNFPGSPYARAFLDDLKK